MPFAVWLVLYIVAQFHGGAGTGEKPASELYGAYLALVYAGAIFGGYVAAGGKMSIILHSLPFEMVMIGGAAARYLLSKQPQ